MIGAIVLAAGSSRRFGDDKRKAKLPNGKMVIQQSVETALTCFDEVTLVLRHGDNEFAAELSTLINDPKLNIFQAPDSALGMGHSLANAMREVTDWDGVFIFLADMPYIRQKTIHSLISVISTEAPHQQSVISTEAPHQQSVISTEAPQARSGEISNRIVVPTFTGQYGHPVGFTRNYFDELAALTGDKGAKPVMNANSGKVIEVAVGDPGVLKDIDTPGDL